MGKAWLPLLRACATAGIQFNDAAAAPGFALGACSVGNAVDGIAFFQKKLSQEAAVLACYACD